MREYYHLRDIYMARPENQWCEVAWQLWGLRLRTQDLHHRKGRRGKMLTDERHFLAVSRLAHDWIHSHGTQSRSMGWLG
jgi:hypothetical protein